MYKFYILFILFCGFYVSSNAQEDSIIIVNPSFEGNAHAGGTNSNIIQGWTDCGKYYFEGETAPDIHMGMEPDSIFHEIYFGVVQPASEGHTFLGFVARNNETYEAVSQRLTSPLVGGKCYEFSIDLSRSLSYVSPFPESPTSNSLKYTKPVVLRIYGGTSPCGKRQLLAESSTVKNTDWKTYDFTFEPKQTFRYFTIAVFYKVPVLVPYNGNLLLDNASNITMTPCPGDEIIAEVEEPIEIVKKDPVKVIKKDPVIAQTPIYTKPKEEPIKPQPKITINKELNRKYLKKGKIMKIKTLTFSADSKEIKEESYPALDELADFLKYYDDLKIEIGGHTNGKPKYHAFCDSLSEGRARAVAEYLYSKDIPKEQVVYKGYGKRDPIATNKTLEGRSRNQRVEIKVLSLGE